MLSMFNVFFFNDTATTEIYTLSLHDALPIFGLVFVWAAFVGLATQYFLNMEIERYTLATGETALTGFSRYWRHWGLFFAILIYFANLWPGWATSSATLMTYLFGGGDPVPIAIAILLLVEIGRAHV